MYGKSYESMYEGSMVGAGINVFAVWNYIIAKARVGAVEINPKLLAFTLGGKEEDVVAALDFLQQPDPLSRSKEEEGRRLVKDGQFQYRIVNWEFYQTLRNAVDRREYNKLKQQEYRAKKAENPVIGDVLPPPATAEPPKKSFARPTIEGVKLQATMIGLPEAEAEKFFHFYESNGWKVGRNSMKSWHSALTNWKSNHQNYGKNGKGSREQRVDRSIGTTNEGVASQYRGLGKMAQVPDPETVAVDPNGQ